MIGVIAALEREVTDIQDQMAFSQKIRHAGMDFFRGKIHEQDVVAVKCGVGKVSAAMCTQILIDKFAVKALINIGVAGGIHPEIEVGDIVISQDSCQYDMDATAFGHPWGEIPNLGMTFFPSDQRMIDKAHKIAELLKLPYRIGRVLTADLGVDDADLKKKLLKEFGGLCVEMEGGAVGQVAAINEVPYVIIRSISDNADGNLTVDYEKNFEASIKGGVDLVLGMINGGF
ncbi:MAG: 5'-methylthioadenosine/adenosylhomocysteine nucleosidase [Eubacteriaceae bacterium]